MLVFQLGLTSCDRLVMLLVFQGYHIFIDQKKNSSKKWSTGPTEDLFLKFIVEKISAKTPKDLLFFLEIFIFEVQNWGKNMWSQKKKKKVFTQSGCIQVDGVERDGRISLLVDLVFDSRF